MAHDGRAIANFVLDFCDAKGRKLTNLSLQKIVYFCHVWNLVDRGAPLVKHEFEAWQFGPVLQYLYREFKEFDRRPITGRASKMNNFSGRQETVKYAFSKEEKIFLETIVEFYSRLPAGQLVHLSHASGGPWDQVWNHANKVNPGMKIDNHSISEFYSRASSPQAVQ